MQRPTCVLEQECYLATLAHPLVHLGVVHDLAQVVLVLFPKVAVPDDVPADIGL